MLSGVYLGSISALSRCVESEDSGSAIWGLSRLYLGSISALSRCVESEDSGSAIWGLSRLYLGSISAHGSDMVMCPIIAGALQCTESATDSRQNVVIYWST